MSKQRSSLEIKSSLETSQHKDSSNHHDKEAWKFLLFGRNTPVNEGILSDKKTLTSDIEKDHKMEEKIENGKRDAWKNRSNVASRIIVDHRAPSWTIS